MQRTKKPIFNQSHYDAVAKTVRENTSFIYTSILTLAEMFLEDNSKFQARLFFIDCGYSGESLEAVCKQFYTR